MASNGVPMDHVEDVLLQAFGDVNEQDVTLEGSFVDQADALVVEDEAAGVGEGLSSFGDGFDGFFGPGVA